MIYHEERCITVEQVIQFLHEASSNLICYKNHTYSKLYHLNQEFKKIYKHGTLYSQKYMHMCNNIVHSLIYYTVHDQNS